MGTMVIMEATINRRKKVSNSINLRGEKDVLY